MFGWLCFLFVFGDVDGNFVSMIINVFVDVLKLGYVVEKVVVTYVASGIGNVEVVFFMEEGNILGVVLFVYLFDYLLMV